MAELTIYDSQGQQIDDEAAPESERVKDFFFDGVRFAVDSVRREAVCFFRARDSTASRSEQYYAIYSYRNRNQLGDLPDRVESRVTDEYGMELDNSQDDTTIFEFIRNGRQMGRPPGDFELRDDLQTVAQQGVSLRLGVPSYEEAYALFQDWHDTETARRFVIADNAQSSNLDEYDVAVEPGAYSGLEPLGATASELDALRERRRQRRQANQPGPSGPLAALEKKIGTGGVVGLFGIALLVGLALIGYGVTCEMGVGQSYVPEIPIVGCGDSDETAQSVSLQDASFSDGSLAVNGTVTSANSTGLHFEIRDENSNVVWNGTNDVEPGENGTFRIQINETLESGTYSLTASIATQDNSTSDPVGFSVNTETVTTNETDEEMAAPRSVSISSTTVADRAPQVSGSVTNASGTVSLVGVIKNETGNWTATKSVELDDSTFSNVSFDPETRLANGSYNLSVSVDGETKTSANTSFQIADADSSPEPTVESLSVTRQGSILDISGTVANVDENTTTLVLVVRNESNEEIWRNDSAEFELTDSSEFDRNIEATDQFQDGENYTLSARVQGTSLTTEALTEFN